MNATSPALAPHDSAPSRPAPELSVVVPTFKERDNVPLLVEQARAHARRHRLGGDLRRRQFTRRHRRGGADDRRRRRPRALHPPHRPARPRRRLHRGHAGEPGALRRRDGCGPAARRDAADADAGAAARRRSRTCGREPLCRRRLGRGARERAARTGEPALDRGGAPSARRDAERSDERLLHDATRPLRGAGAAAFLAGLQDPARYRGDSRSRPAHHRIAVRFRRAPAWREQARYAGRARFCRARAREADRRCGLFPFPAVLPGRAERHRDPHGDAATGA